ncbi:MAG: type II toxin-antitoxin system RelE/ParE family toxin [Phycisphaerae bacterium]|jgi:mRNA interferase RelE/StbE
MAYAVTFKAGALRQLEKLPRITARRIVAKAASLSADPRPAGAVKLVGGGLWRVRVGDYRIVYLIDDARRSVDVRIVAHRREVYRGM